MRWFHGWFNALSNWYNFRSGNGRTVLELGCSIGAASRILAERGFKVTATDISSYAINNARKVNQHPNLQFKTLDIETTKRNESFDLLFAFEVIEHLEQLEDSLSNMFALLKKGGVCICSTPYPYSHVFTDKTHVNVRHPLDWERLFKKAGFANIKMKQVGFVPFFYRYSKNWHITFPFGLPTPYINSPVFIYAQKN